MDIVDHRSVNARRVREHRTRRKSAGLVEVRMWVCEEDRGRVHQACAPFTKKADYLVKSLRYAQFADASKGDV